MYIMTSLHKTNTKSVFTIEGIPDIDLSLVFSRDYFLSVGLKHFHISHKYHEPEKNENTELDDTIENSDDVVQDLENKERNIAEKFLSKESFPNGYTQLPLKQTGGGVVDTISDYVAPFFTSKRSIDETLDHKSLESMKITFPHHNVQSFMEWKNEHMDGEQSLYSFQGTTITYDILDQVLDDLYAQFQYMHDSGFTYSNISLDFIYVIDDHFVLLDGNSIKPFDTHNTLHDKDGCKSMLQIIFQLLEKKQNDIHIDFSEIRNTRVYYILMRLQNDGVFVL